MTTTVIIEHYSRQLTGFPGDAVEEARSIVHSLSQWTSPPSRTLTAVRGNGYAFSTEPPRSERRVRDSALEWNVPATEDERLNIQDLEEFQSTQLVILHRTHIDSSAGGESARAQASPPEPLKAELVPPGPQYDLSSFIKLIPEPHSLPSNSYKLFQIPVGVLPYSPDTQIILKSVPSSPYDRRAWIIPVRGELPWSGVSSAVVIHPGPDNQAVPSFRTTIVWTPASVREFWSFLCSIRDSQTFGAVGISFNPTYRKDIPMPVACGFARSPIIRSLDCVDYFKVHHDAGASVYLRGIFDRWEFAEGDSPRKLRGARFALVDSSSTAILIS